MKFGSILAAAAITSTAVFACSANAETMSYEYDFSAPVTNSFMMDDVSSVTISLPKFDSALGKFNFATVKLSGAFSANIVLENNVNFATDDNELLMTGTMRVLGPYDEANSPDIFMAADAPAPLGAKDDVEGSGADYLNVDLVSEVVANTQKITDVNDLSVYVGEGNVNLVLQAAAGLAYDGPMYDEGMYDANMTVNDFLASGKVTITYDYVPVPEPASLSLVSLCGLALLRRRK